MSSVKAVWTWVVGIFVVILLVIAIIIWKSYQPNPTAEAERKEVLSNLDNKKEPLSSSSSTTTISGEPAADLPAPAKKLHNLLRDEADASNIDAGELTKRIESLNSDIKEINRELEKQGVFVPANADPQSIDTASTDGDTAEISERLQAIKDFMEKKEQTEGTESN